MTMTNISSYYHNLKLGPVGMLEVGGGGEPFDEIASSWGVEFRSRVDQRARLPLYFYILPTNTLQVWNYAIRL